MKLLLAAALALGFQAGPLDEFYKFKPETTWTYKRTEKGAERKITARVTAEENGKTLMEWKDDNGEQTKVTWSVANGLLTVEARSKKEDEEEHVLTIPLLKEGSKKDDTWSADIGEFTHKGEAEVTVPAGTYKNATWTQLRIGDAGKLDFYLVPKVGLVKIEIGSPDDGANRFELAEFKEPKK